MYTIEKTKAALIKRFEQNGWNELKLTLKTGDNVWITPCVYGKDATSVEDVEYFLMNSDSVHLYGADNIEKVAETLNNFSQIKAADEKDKIELKMFFKKNLEGKTEKDWELASSVHSLVYEKWNKRYDSGEEISLVDYLNNYLYEVADELNMSLETTTKAMELAENAKTYSDWYKGVWGHRPRY